MANKTPNDQNVSTRNPSKLQPSTPLHESFRGVEERNLESRNIAAMGKIWDKVYFGKEVISPKETTYIVPDVRGEVTDSARECTMAARDDKYKHNRSPLTSDGSQGDEWERSELVWDSIPYRIADESVDNDQQTHR